jgi:acetyltransferase-like isoleucine patch superfamily enzyme
VEIADRAFLDVGDFVVFGHRVALYPHVVDRRKNGDIILYLKRIHIGDRAFIGAGSRLGPGATIPDDSRLPAQTDVFINERFEET